MKNKYKKILQRFFLSAVLLTSIILGTVNNVFAAESSNVPDYNVWLADSFQSGLNNDGSGIYKLFRDFQKPVYSELGGYLLEDEPLAVLSAGWLGCFKEEFRKNPYYIYTTILMDYLTYDADSADMSAELSEKINAFGISIFTEITDKYGDSEQNILMNNWDNMSVGEAEDYYNKNIKSVENMGEALSKVKSFCSTGKELTEAVCQYLALQEVKQERIILLSEAREVCANMSSPNKDFIKAVDIVLKQLNATEIEYSLIQGTKMAWGNFIDKAWGLLGEAAPPLKNIELMASGFDVLFGTTDGAENNIKLILLYTFDNYFQNTMYSVSNKFILNKTQRNAQAFNACFKAYTQFQLYGNSFAKQWINDVVNGGTLNGLFTLIYQRDNLKGAQELQKHCENQNAIRKRILELMDQHSNIYTNKYLKPEWQDKLSRVPVTGIIGPQKSTVVIEDTYSALWYYFDASVTPANATNKKVVFTSSNPEIISIDKNGENLKIKGTGTVILTAKTEEGGYSIKQTVVVKEKSPDKVEGSELFAGGTGTIENPFLIENTQQFSYISKYPYLNYRLVSDLNLHNSKRIDSFRGNLDGNNHNISVSFSAENGLFNLINEGGVVKNLNVRISMNTNDSVQEFGGIAYSNSGTIENCSISGNISASGLQCYNLWYGGMALYNSGIIRHCKSDVNLIYTEGFYADSRNHKVIGGIAGRSFGKIDKCLNQGNINIYQVDKIGHVGGIAGIDEGTILNCINSAPSIVMTYKNYMQDAPSTQEIGFISGNEFYASTSYSHKKEHTVAGTNCAIGTKSKVELHYQGYYMNSDYIFDSLNTKYPAYSQDEVNKWWNNSFRNVKIQSIVINKSTITLQKPEDTVKLIVKLFPYNATNKTVLWRSSNTNIASVDSSGNVKALSAGETLITAITEDGNKTAACVVKVKENVKRKIIYDVNGGKNPPAAQSVEDNKATTLSKTKPTRTGYTFEGWATSKTATKASYQPGVSYKTNKDITLYAVWKANTYKISFNKNGGSGSMSTVSRTYNKAAALPGNTFKRSGYKFKGWNTKSDGSGTGYTDKANVKNLTSAAEKTVTLYAQWAKGLKLTYNANGGKVSSASKTVYQGSSYGTMSTPSRTGYTFAGWYTTKSGGSKVTATTKVAKSNNHTLYAHWNKSKYTIKYVLNGGKNNTANPAGYYVSSSSITLKNPSRTGYAFAGWYTNSSYKTKVSQIKKGSTGNKTFYAKWSANTYTIRYNKNGGTSGSMADTKSCKYGTSYNLCANAFKRTGYTFAGWATSSSGTVVYKNKASVKNLTSTNKAVKTLYAKWTPYAYTINYHLNGGKNSSSNPSSYKISTATITLRNPSRTGYTFKGWYVDSGYKKKITQIAKGSTGMRNVYAKWTVNTYTIRYDKNGATSGSMSDSASCKYGTEYNLRPNTFKRTGYTFAGWATSSSGTVVYKDKASVKNLTSTNKAVKTLYAKWTPYAYTINYHLNGGKNSSSNPFSYKISTSTITLKNPSKTGYTFKGWYADSGYKKKITQITKGSTGTKNVYAKWTVNTYTIRYDKNGATSGSMADSASCKYGTEYSLRKNTYIRRNFKFTGWNTQKDGSGKFYNDSAKVKNLTTGNNKTILLYAQWQALVTKISFENTTAELKTGDSYQLNPVITPTNVAAGVEYLSEDQTIAAVNQEGIISAIAAGETKIHCKATDGSGIQADVKVVVTDPSVEVTGVEVSINEMTVKVGDQFPLGVRIMPSNATDQTVTWSSSDTSVIIVDESGNVTAVGAGEVDVIATANNGIADTGRINVESNTIPICSAEDLARISNDLNGEYELTEDLDLSGYEWIPLGGPSAPFSGSLKGNGHTISGLTITDAAQEYSGLFGYLTGEVQDIILEGQINLTDNNGSRYRYAGSFAAYSKKAKILNCISYVSVNAENVNTTQGTYIYAGGIAGKADAYTQIENCVNYGSICATAYNGTRASTWAGGITGECSNGTVLSGCTNNGEIVISSTTEFSNYWASAYAGGITGSAGVAQVIGAVNNQSVTAKAYPVTETSYESSAAAGGIAGYATQATIDGESATDEIHAEGNEYAKTYMGIVTGRYVE